MKILVGLTILFFSFLIHASPRIHLQAARVLLLYNTDNGSLLVVSPDDNYSFEVVERSPSVLTMRVYNSVGEELGSNFVISNVNIARNFLSVSVSELVTTLEASHNVGSPPCNECETSDDNLNFDMDFDCETISDLGNRMICIQNKDIIQLLTDLNEDLQRRRYREEREAAKLLIPGEYIGTDGNCDESLRAVIISHSEDELVMRWNDSREMTYQCRGIYCSITFFTPDGIFGTRRRHHYENDIVSSTVFIDERLCKYELNE